MFAMREWMSLNVWNVSIETEVIWTGELNELGAAIKNGFMKMDLEKWPQEITKGKNSFQVVR